MAGKHLTIEEKEMIRECFESGMTIRETAELTGRSTATIKLYPQDSEEPELRDREARCSEGSHRGLPDREDRW